MNDTPGVPSALGIDRVEWFAEEDDRLTVRVTGRWRRRRPTWGGPATLVIEAQGTRHRFPAMPEPPSLSGAAPGTWRMSFSVPSLLLPEISRIWLAVGAIVEPLPIPVQAEIAGPLGAAGGEPPPPSRARAHGDEEREERLRIAELAVQNARRRAADAQAAAAAMSQRLERLEVELEHARARLEDAVAERDRALRAAEQRVHAERAQRLELEEQLAQAVREASRGSGDALRELGAAEARIHELEQQIESLRRRADEAEHAAAVARAGSSRVERHERTESSRAEWHERTEVLRLERELAVASRRTVAERPRVEPRVLGGAAARARELEERATERRRAQPALRAAAPVGERELLAELRDELHALAELAEGERTARVAAEQRAERLEQALRAHELRTARVSDAIAGLRAQLEAVRALRPSPGVGSGAGPGPGPGARSEPGPSPGPSTGLGPGESGAGPGPSPAGPVEPERLAAALARLREETPAPRQDVVAGPAHAGAGSLERVGRAWLAPVFRELVRLDPGDAGRLLLQLLPAQGAVEPRPVAYDLILAERSCIRVTTDGAATEVELAEQPRELSQVQLQLRGDPSSIARLLAAGALRRRLGRGIARVRGERSRLSALEALVRNRLTLLELHRAGVRLDAALALKVAALMVDPALTVGERFTIAHEPRPAGPAGRTYLYVRDGADVSVGAGVPEATVAMTIASPTEALLPLLAGERPADVEIHGNERPLALLQNWIALAQAG